MFAGPPNIARQCRAGTFPFRFPHLRHVASLLPFLPSPPPSPRRLPPLPPPPSPRQLPVVRGGRLNPAMWGWGNWQEVIAVLARVGTQDPNTETRIEAARTLVNNVFDGLLGLPPTSPPSGEGPKPSSEHTVGAAAMASAAAAAAAAAASATEAPAAAAAEVAEATPTTSEKVEGGWEGAGKAGSDLQKVKEKDDEDAANAAAAAAAEKKKEAEAAAANAAAEKKKEAEAAVAAEAEQAAAAAAAQKKKEEAAAEAAAAKKKEDAAAEKKKKEQEAAAAAGGGREAREDTRSKARETVEPERPGESLRDAFARRLSAGGKDGKTPAQELAQLEWDLTQLEARTDNLNERVPQVVEYIRNVYYIYYIYKLYTHTHTHTHTHPHTHTHTHISYIYIYIYIYITYVCIFVCVYVCMRVCVCIYNIHRRADRQSE